MKKIELKIYILDDIDYVGILEEVNGTIKIDTIMDRDEWEKMLKFLINTGDIKLNKISNYDMDIKTKKINNIEELLKNLKQDFKIKYKEI